jgi:hypothetical protein
VRRARCRNPHFRSFPTLPGRTQVPVLMENWGDLPNSKSGCAGLHKFVQQNAFVRCLYRQVRREGRLPRPGPATKGLIEMSTESQATHDWHIDGLRTRFEIGVIVYRCNVCCCLQIKNGGPDAPSVYKPAHPGWNPFKTMDEEPECRAVPGAGDLCDLIELKPQ